MELLVRRLTEIPDVFDGCIDLSFFTFDFYNVLNISPYIN